MTEKLKGNAGKISPTRIDNLVKLINVFREREMSLLEMGEAIGFTKDGARSYMYDLTNAEVISVVRMAPGRPLKRESVGSNLSKPIYALNPDHNIIAAYIDRINALRPTIHVMQDDEVFKVKRASDKIPAHTELMSFFYNIGNKEVAA